MVFPKKALLLLTFTVVVHFFPRSYPVRDTRGWTLLGHFTGEDTREAQSFKIEHPQHFAKYLKLEFVSHIGTEYYCPISVLRVFGVTMVEDYNSRQVNAGLASCPSVHALQSARYYGAPSRL